MSATAVMEKPDLAAIMAADPGKLFETVAREQGVTIRAVVEALPETMRRIAPGTAFIDAMADIATWARSR